MGNDNTNPIHPAFVTIRGNNASSDLVTSTQVVAKECLDVYVAGGGTSGTEYTDDSLEFVTGVGVGTAFMAKYFDPDDTVDAGDIGILAMTEDRKLMVDASLAVGAISLDSEYTDDAMFTPDTSIGQAVGGYAGLGNLVDAGDFGAFAMSTYREQFTSLSVNGTVATILPDVGMPFADEAANALVTFSGCYGYDATAVAGAKMKPLIVDIDDGFIDADQTAQLVINENYIYDPLAMGWLRQTGTAGVIDVNVTAIPEPVTIKSPLNTGFKSFDHSDHDINRIVFQDPPFKDGRKNEATPATFGWTVPAGSSGAYSTGIGVLKYPFEGNYCLNLYEGAAFDYSQMVFKMMGCPWDDSGLYTADKIAVFEGRFQMQDSVDATASYCFGFHIWDGMSKWTYVIDIHAALGIYNAYVGTANAANALIGATTVSVDAWNYFRLEVYPPQHGLGPLFKNLYINGTSYAVGALAPYAVIGPFNGCAPAAITFLAAEGTDSFWDELAFWTYYEEYVEE